ncbi:MAG TPA: hypothetical protein VMB71_14380, partial [Acetobacteraceae bacterium]|nr:hypothetical protein [Acetobacteraceae bacterium]
AATPEPEKPQPTAKSHTTTRTATVRIPSLKPIAPGRLFIALIGAARACLALEARLTGATTTAKQSRDQIAAALRADPRRRALRDAFVHITTENPDRREILRETTKAIDAELIADPEQKTGVAELIVAICHNHNIIIDPATLPDPLLDLLIEYCEPGGVARGDVTCIKPVDPDGYHPPTGPP